LNNISGQTILQKTFQKRNPAILRWKISGSDVFDHQY